jgi:hypothetical protein
MILKPLLKFFLWAKEAEKPHHSMAFDGIFATKATSQKTEDGLWMIWADFFDNSQNSLPKDKPLPIDIELHARMVILNNEAREKVHQAKISIGKEFYCHEGPRRVAFGRITKITGLYAARRLG